MLNRKTSTLSVSLIISLTLFYIYFFSQIIPGQFIHSSSLDKTPDDTPNRTLGFEHIYVINLAYRLDRRARMDAIANSLNLDFDFFPGVSSEDVDILKEYDFNIAPNHKTCYVSHYRVYESIVQNGYGSALILEDDVDFETNTSSIMREIYRVLPTDWEMFYPGHCTWEGEGEQVGNTTGYELFKSTGPFCTHAYAVTLSAAEKLIKELTHPWLPIDMQLIETIKTKNVSSYSLEPSLIVQWKSKDDPSDVSPGADQWTFPLRNSTLHSLGYQEIV